jgi:hypothetical protein
MSSYGQIFGHSCIANTNSLNDESTDLKTATLYLRTATFLECFCRGSVILATSLVISNQKLNKTDVYCNFANFAQRFTTWTDTTLYLDGQVDDWIVSIDDRWRKQLSDLNGGFFTLLSFASEFGILTKYALREFDKFERYAIHETNLFVVRNSQRRFSKASNLNRCTGFRQWRAIKKSPSRTSLWHQSNCRIRAPAAA